MNECNVSRCSSVGCSGYRAIIVWKYFHVARPNSALFNPELSAKSRLHDIGLTHLTVSFPNRDITTSPFNSSSLGIFDPFADLSMCPGARMAGLGGP